MILHTIYSNFHISFTFPLRNVWRMVVTPFSFPSCVCYTEETGVTTTHHVPTQPCYSQKDFQFGFHHVSSDKWEGCDVMGVLMTSDDM